MQQVNMKIESGMIKIAGGGALSTYVEHYYTKDEL